jgi:cytochrome bd-type quinol oxidase subunit 2
MTIWQAAAATESLWVIFWGAVIVLPTIIGTPFTPIQSFVARLSHSVITKVIVDALIKSNRAQKVKDF